MTLLVWFGDGSLCAHYLLGRIAAALVYTRSPSSFRALRSLQNLEASVCANNVKKQKFGLYSHHQNVQPVLVCINDMKRHGVKIPAL